jgi:hypothetical protein
MARARSAGRPARHRAAAGIGAHRPGRRPSGSGGNRRGPQGGGPARGRRLPGGRRAASRAGASRRDLLPDHVRLRPGRREAAARRERRARRVRPLLGALRAELDGCGRGARVRPDDGAGRHRARLGHLDAARTAGSGTSEHPAGIPGRHRPRSAVAGRLAGGHQDQCDREPAWPARCHRAGRPPRRPADRCADHRTAIPQDLCLDAAAVVEAGTGPLTPVDPRALRCGCGGSYTPAPAPALPACAAAAGAVGNAERSRDLPSGPRERSGCRASVVRRRFLPRALPR